LAVRGALSVEQPASNYFIGARRRQRRIVESPFGKDRREARRNQEHVALADRHVELLRKKKHHVAARLRTAGFQKNSNAASKFRCHMRDQVGSNAAVGATGAKGRRPAGDD
jgi:hypothetical protein